MTRPIARHDWVVGACCVDADAQHAGSPATLLIDAHRNRRGPFTATGSFIRALIDDANTTEPRLVRDNLLTLLLVAPEIGGRIEVPKDVLAASMVSREGNPASSLQRVANGAADFVLGCLAAGRRGGTTAIVTHVDHADPADQIFLATLLRRADPQILRLRLHTTSSRLTPPLAGALGQYARRRRRSSGTSKASGLPAVWAKRLGDLGLDKDTATALWSDLSSYDQGWTRRLRRRPLATLLDDVIARLRPAERRKLAQAHVDADGTSHRLLAEHAYGKLPASTRKAMHRARAATLAGLCEPSLALGAIPFHHEQAGGNAEALLAASRCCLDMACYDAALDWSLRGRRMLAGAPLRTIAGDLTRNTLFSLLLLGRHDDVASLCEEALSQRNDTALQAHATYAMAILNARLYEASRRDYDAAKSWIERSRKFTDSMPASAVRAVNAAFLMNTLALVEMRKGRAEVAEQTLAEALALMARDAPDLYAAESVILLHNMARLAVATGRAELAMAHLRTLLRQQPSDSGAWFDRGVIHQKAARHGQALADYDAAIRWEGAHAEAHFNRAQTLAALQRTGEAIAGYGRVLVLDPEFPDARLNRAILSFERGDLASACDDIAAAVTQQPGNARALCMSGLIAMRMGDHDAALDAFARSIVADPSLADPWANRAIIAFRRGDLGAALDDLTRALELRDDAVILCNRARIFEAKRQWQKAAADYSRARALDGADAASIERGTRRCMDALSRATSPIS